MKMQNQNTPRRHQHDVISTPQENYIARAASLQGRGGNAQRMHPPPGVIGARTHKSRTPGGGVHKRTSRAPPPWGVHDCTARAPPFSYLVGVHNCTLAHHLHLWSLDLGYGLHVIPVAAGLDCDTIVFLHASLVWEMSYFLVIYCFLCPMCHHGFRMLGLVDCRPW